MNNLEKMRHLATIKSNCEIEEDKLHEWFEIFGLTAQYDHETRVFSVNITDDWSGGEPARFNVFDDRIEVSFSGGFSDCRLRKLQAFIQWVLFKKVDK